MERAGDFIEIHQRIRTVDQQQVQVVGAQLAQRILGRGDDVAGAGVIVLDGVLRARIADQLDAAFADDLHAVAQRRLQRQRLAERGFHAIAAVDIGVVEAGHAHRQRLLDPLDALLRRELPFIHAPHAGDDARQRQAAW
jgi:hypothetical protein